MTLRWYSAVIDCRDVRAQATWWAEALGARRVDVGQSAADDFTVLADPEGNEFCVLSSRDA